MARQFDKAQFGAADGDRQQQAVNPLRALLVDPNNLNWQFDGTRQPSQAALTFGTLRSMALRCQPVAAIVLTRQDQVANFAKRPEFEGDFGLKVRMKDKEAKPTTGDRKRMREIEDLLLRSGVGPAKRRPSLDPLLRAIVRDSLTLDAIALELRNDNAGRLFDWWPVDAATIRLAAPTYEPNRAMRASTAAQIWGMRGEGYGGVAQATDAEIAFVQMLEGVPRAEFTDDELAYWIRNPRTDLESNGYGFSELEFLIEIVTGYLNGMTYNSRYFTHGNIPDGVLSVIGKYNQESLDSFMRYWNAMVSGVQNSHRVPVMATQDGKGAAWTPIKNNNKEMQFHEWLDFLTRIACAIYRIDPEEIGMGAKAVGEAGGLGGGGDNDSTLKHSLQKGLTPILRRVQSGFNDDILPRIPNTEDYEAVFTGIDPDQEERKIDLATKKIQGGISTANEERVKLDMPEIPQEALWGDAPGNQTVFQAWTMAMGGGQGGDPNDPNADPNAQPPDADPNAQQAPVRLPRIAEDGSEEYDDEQDAPAGM